MNLTVNANHTVETYRLANQTFTVNVHSSHRVNGDDVNGYYAIAPGFGCGRHCSTPERAIQSLLADNGCTGITVQAEPEPAQPSHSDQGASLATAVVDYIDAVPETLETLQQAEFWHGYLMAESNRVAAGKRSAAEYDRARARLYKALTECDLAFPRIDEMRRDLRASVLFSHTDGDTVERGEYTLTVRTEYDSDYGTPWDNDCGHGPVSDWTTRDKRPGELVLSSERGSARFYDYAEACRIARRDGWGFLPAPLQTWQDGDYWLATCNGVNGGLPLRGDTVNAAVTALYASHRATMTPRQYAAAAAMSDYERLRQWCNDQWHYVGIIVTVTDQNGQELARESLWGIESDCDEYLLQVAEELALQALESLA